MLTGVSRDRSCCKCLNACRHRLITAVLNSCVAKLLERLGMPVPKPPPRKYMTKSEKRAAALKFGVRWREHAQEAKARRATLKLRAAEAGVRTAGRFEEPISPDREQKRLEFSPYKLPPLSKRAPPVSPEKLNEFKLYKGVNDVEAWKEDTQRSSISRHLKSGTTQSSSLKAWAVYRGWSDPRAGHPSSWAMQERDLKQKLKDDRARRERVKEGQHKAQARQEARAKLDEERALRAEKELCEAREQISALKEQMEAGQAIAEATINDLELRLEEAEAAMKAVDSAAAFALGPEESARSRSIVPPGVVETQAATDGAAEDDVLEEAEAALREGGEGGGRPRARKDTFDERVAAVRKQLDEQHAIAHAAGHEFDEFESLFDDLREQYIREEVSAADSIAESLHARAAAPSSEWSDSDADETAGADAGPAAQEDGTPSAPAEQEPAAAAEVPAEVPAESQPVTENDNAKEAEVAKGAAGADG